MNSLKKLILSCLSTCMCITLLNPLNVYATGEDIVPEDQPFTEIEVTVLEEDESSRTEYSKDFIMSDGTMQKIIYSVPVHYKDDGKWKEIDNTLSLNEAYSISDDEEVSGYETGKSKTKVKFSKMMHKKNLASITSDRYRITWGMMNFNNRSEAEVISDEGYDDKVLKVLNNISSTVQYRNIMKNVSLRYSADSLGVKEDIIIEDRQNENTFSFEYRTKNLRLGLNESGEIEVRDTDTDKIIFIMPKPYMKDASEAISDDVFYVLKENNEGKYNIDIVADRSWLNDEDRVYPVVIDPIIQTETQKSAIDTTFVTLWKKTTNIPTRWSFL